MATGSVSILRGLMSEPILVGRERECQLISDLMNQRKNIAVFGDRGVGKTAIIKELLKGRNVKQVLYSGQSGTLKEALCNLVKSGKPSRTHVERQNTLALKKICYGMLVQRPEYIVFDHIAWVEPKFYAFLVYLIERELPLIIITRGLGRNTLGHLWMALYSFERVEVKNLDKPRTENLVSAYTKALGIRIEREADFNHEIFEISGGNPKIVKQLCLLAKDEKYGKKGYLDVRLMDLDRRIKESVA